MVDKPYEKTINDWKNGIRVVERERRSGAKHVTIDVKSEVIAVNLNPLELGRPVAEAIAQVIREGIQSITAPAAEATVLKRKYAKTALASGKGWAVRRYTGGRTGKMEPDAAMGSRLFNDSGRLAKTIAAGPTSEGDWKINTAVNRLDAATFGPGQFEIMIERLVQHVPVLRDPTRLGDTPEVRAALEKTAERAVMKKDHAAAEALAQIGQFGSHVSGILDQADIGEPPPDEQG